MTDIKKMTVFELSKALKNKELKSVEITEEYLKTISDKDKEIGAYITVTNEHAIKKAKEIDERRLSDEESDILSGIPMGIKDNICTKGILTTCASKTLSNFIPPYNATVIEKLANCIMLGKTNMDEFAMGSTTENSYFKVTKNPVDLSRVPGGSSGGSAAAVAALETPFALGSDTGGSVRQPAAFCGVVGLKPTYGLVSRYGLVAFASSLDQIGPVTKDVRDCAIVLNQISGWDKMDSTSVKRESIDYTNNLESDIKGLKIAIVKEHFDDGLSTDIKDAVLASARQFEKMGAEIIEVSMQNMEYALSAYYILSSAEASSNLSRYDGVKYGFRFNEYNDIDELYKNTRNDCFGSEVKRRIMLGTFALSSGYYDAYYKKAMQVKTLIINDYNKIFKECDLIISPVAPTTAYKIGQNSLNPVEMYMGDCYTVPINLAGLPAISIPCGTDKNNLPIGLQIIGKPFSEERILNAAYAFEKSYKGV